MMKENFPGKVDQQQLGSEWWEWWWQWGEGKLIGWKEFIVGEGIVKDGH